MQLIQKPFPFRVMLIVTESHEVLFQDIILLVLSELLKVIKANRIPIEAAFDPNFIQSAVFGTGGTLTPTHYKSNWSKRVSSLGGAVRKT